MPGVRPPAAWGRHLGGAATGTQDPDPDPTQPPSHPPPNMLCRRKVWPSTSPASCTRAPRPAPWRLTPLCRWGVAEREGGMCASVHVCIMRLVVRALDHPPAAATPRPDPPAVGAPCGERRGHRRRPAPPAPRPACIPGGWVAGAGGQAHACTAVSRAAQGRLPAVPSPSSPSAPLPAPRNTPCAPQRSQRRGRSQGGRAGGWAVAVQVACGQQAASHRFTLNTSQCLHLSPAEHHHNVWPRLWWVGASMSCPVLGRPRPPPLASSLR